MGYQWSQVRFSVSLVVLECVYYNGVGELVMVDRTMKSTDYIDIVDSIETMFGDAIYIQTLQCTSAYNA